MFHVNVVFIFVLQYVPCYYCCIIIYREEICLINVIDVLCFTDRK